MIVFLQNELPNSKGLAYVWSPRWFKDPNVDKKMTPNIGIMPIRTKLDSIYSKLIINLNHLITKNNHRIRLGQSMRIFLQN